MRSSRSIVYLAPLISILFGACAVTVNAGEASRSVPVIYCTDLFHPHDDPDDHFDLATLYALPELDIKGIVLDQGRKQLGRPGRIPVSQMNKITGRNVPAVIGLGDPLRSPEDKALEQPAQFQEGVRLILDTLRTSVRPVCIAAVGSVRDVVSAFNREPRLFRTNVAMVLVFIGEASDAGFQEYNVGLDPQACVGLMRSGLPVYWVPCFDGGLWQNKGHASFWRASHRALLERSAPAVQQYFIYALEKETSDASTFLTRPVEPERRERLFSATRNLWCTAIFGAMAGREVISKAGHYVSVSPGGPLPATNAGPGKPLFGFSEVEIKVNDKGVVTFGRGPGFQKVKRFDVLDPGNYASGMTEATAGLLSSLGRKGDASRE